MTSVNDSKTPTRIKYGLAAILTLVILRVVRLAYQRSKLTDFVEKVIGGDDETVKLNQDLVDTLPKTSLSLTGRKAEPINLILAGSAANLDAAFTAAGWLQAVPVDTASWLEALWAILTRGPYPDGPITPFYLGSTPHDVAFQKETERHNFAERHHVRLWQTNLRLASGEAIWLGSASFDRSMRIFRGLGMPYHHIDPDIDAERDFIAGELVHAGAERKSSFKLTQAHSSRNTFHDRYHTDGAVVALVVGPTPTAETL